MYQADSTRYDSMLYRRCGASGLKLPAVSLGLWHNFGDTASYANMKEICCTAFDLGITHFDLANNYGPEPGSAEINFGRIVRENFLPYRDEMIIATKAGYNMWPGPYGDWGSRKYLLASLISSIITGWILKRPWKKPWVRLHRLYAAVRRCTPEFPTTTGLPWKRQPRS